MRPFYILSRLFYWSYERGTWQYDLLCVGILSFIFLVPASVFDDPEARSRRAGLGAVKEHRIPVDTVRSSAFEADIQSAVGDREVQRVEPVRDENGRITGYRVWSRSRTRSGGGMQ